MSYFLCILCDYFNMTVTLSQSNRDGFVMTLILKNSELTHKVKKEWFGIDQLNT